jgi:hypothetical protein
VQVVLHRVRETLALIQAGDYADAVGYAQVSVLTQPVDVTVGTSADPAVWAVASLARQRELPIVRVMVLSDTHLRPWSLRLHPRLVSALATVDAIIHAGDFACVEAYDLFASFAPLHAVRGNVDEPEVRGLLPRTRVVDLDERRIGVIHGDGLGGTTLMRARAAFAGKDGPRVDCVVFGHSHMPHCERSDGVLYLNPGSPTDPRRATAPSFAILTVGRRVEAEIIWL